MSTIKMKIKILWKNIECKGVLGTVIAYVNRIWCLIFVKFTFGRTDISIYHPSRLSGLKSIKIGRKFCAGRGLWLEAVMDYPATGQKFSPKLIIGDRVNIGEYVHIGCNYRVVIGDDVLMGSKIYITDHNHGIYCGDFQEGPNTPPINRKLTEGAHVEIGDRCWIGEFVTILPGVTIGKGSIIGSHSTVTHDIPANSIAVGSPARVVKVWDDSKNVWERI